MKFSVIVPVYNVEAYLDDCLQSLQKQDFKDYEVICVNDGATDRSREILTAWEARLPQMRVIDRENGGLSAARNTGLGAAQGEYVLFVDSDDWVEPRFLECLHSSLITHRSSPTPLDMLCFACRKDDSGKSDTLPAEQNDGWSYYNRHVLEARIIPFVCVWQRCYRRQFLLDNGLRFREGILHEDNEFTPRACLRARTVRVIPDVLYNYRVRPNSIMTTRGTRSKESLVLIGNELSELFATEADIDRTTAYRALTQYYQMAFVGSTRDEKRHLRHLVEWTCYRRVSRTKLRHRINYLRNKYL